MPRLRVPAWVWALAAIPRFLIIVPFFWRPEQPQTGDSLGYWTLARNMVQLGQYTLSGAPETFRPPGYPIFLAPIAAIFRSPGLPVALIQSALGVITVAVAWQWIDDWAGKKGASLAAIALSLDPVSLFHTPLVLNETLYNLFLVFTLVSTWNIASLSSPELKPNASIRTGALWSVLTIVKPIAFYLPVLVSFLFFQNRRCWAIFLISAYLIPSIWIARNWNATGHPEFSSAGGFALIRYPAAGVESLRTGRPMSELQEKLPAAVDATFKSTYRNDADQSAAYTQAALPIILRHPFLLIRYCFWGTLKVLGGTGLEMILDWAGPQPKIDIDQKPQAEISGHGTLMLLKQHRWLIPVEAIYLTCLLALYLCAFGGFMALWHRGHVPQVLLLTITALYLLAVASIEGYYRYRIPLMPPLAALAAARFRRE